MSSRELYVALILAVCAERLLELILTRRNAARLTARGGHEVGEAHFPWMALLHTLLLIGAPVEVYLLGRPFQTWLGMPMLGVLTATMGLRYWAILTLGDRWTARVFVVPGEAPVLGGPYRFFRHPNYLAVIFEVAALPLIHGAWLTALLGSVANAFVLQERIRVEEEALASASDYYELLGARRAWVPGARPASMPEGENGDSMI